ncbi:unnamed protein product [Closterium sp. NIES-54]
MLRRFRFARLGLLPIQPHAALSRLFPLRNAPLTFLRALPREPPRACPSDARPRHFTVVAGRRNHGGGAMKQRPKDWRPQSTPFHARNRSPRRNDRTVPLGPRGGNGGDSGDGSAESAGRMQRDVADLGADWRLGPGEAVGRVMSAQANFVRAVVQDVALPRASEILDPPVANADHLLLLFSLAQPPPEPTNVSRFLVAAEATGVAVSLVFNKADLVDEQCPLPLSPLSPFSTLLLSSSPTSPPLLPSHQATKSSREGVSDFYMQFPPHSLFLPLPFPPIPSRLLPSPSPLSRIRQCGSGSSGRQSGGLRCSHALLPVSSLPLLLTLPLPPATLLLLFSFLTSSFQAVQEWQQRAAEWGYQLLTCSVERRIGIRHLAGPGGLLAGRTTVIAGPSGVGKSSLINAVLGEAYSGDAYNGEICDADGLKEGREGEGGEAKFEELRVGEVSKRSGRGRHTTRHVALVKIPDLTIQGDAAATVPDVTIEGGATSMAQDVIIQGGMTRQPVDGDFEVPQKLIEEGDTRQRVEGVRVQEEDAVYSHSSSTTNSSSSNSNMTNSNSSSSNDLSSSSSSSSSSSGGLLADSPGFSQPSLANVSASDLPMLFPEIRSRLAASPTACAFADCRHISEPGCAVDSGWERYRHYVMLMDEIRVREAAEIRAVGTKREGDVRLKSGGYGVVVAEPRLEAKKHRRESRKKGKQLLLQQLAVEEEEDEEEGVGFAGGYGGSEKRR